MWCNCCDVHLYVWAKIELSYVVYMSKNRRWWASMISVDRLWFHIVDEPHWWQWWLIFFQNSNSTWFGTPPWMPDENGKLLWWKWKKSCQLFFSNAHVLVWKKDADARMLRAWFQENKNCGVPGWLIDLIFWYLGAISHAYTALKWIFPPTNKEISIFQQTLTQFTKFTLYYRTQNRDGK